MDNDLSDSASEGTVVTPGAEPAPEDVASDEKTITVRVDAEGNAMVGRRKVHYGVSLAGAEITVPK